MCEFNLNAGLERVLELAAEIDRWADAVGTADDGAMTPTDVARLEELRVLSFDAVVAFARVYDPPLGVDELTAVD